MPNGSDSVSYDLFLSYNSADHRIVEEVAHKLASAGLKKLFLDRWNLPIGTRWRPMLEESLSCSKAVAIFVGPGEMGSWQQREVDVALDLQSRNPNLPVIPVLLCDCEPPLGFLRQLTWVDLRTQTLDLGIAILAKAARGEAPGPDLQKHLDAVRSSICPYRGLLHFREEDAPFFFGREAVIDQLTDKVRRQPFVALVGASGSGKSSVVRAGLLPRLRSDGNAAWETMILVPTDQPLKALARAFLPLLEPSMGEVDRLAEVTKLAEHFRLGTISLYDIIERIFEKQSGNNRVLIVVDQFEELYTLTSVEEARRRFLDELLTTTSRAGSKANVLLGMRGDFVGKALAYRPLSDRLQDAQINLGPMTREELECAIRKPADKIQLEFESGLVRRILDDVGDEPGNLPLLEFVLKDLWDERHGRVLLNESYDKIGGLQGAVATKADDLLKGLSSAEQKILQRVFLRIVRPSESGLDTRRRAAFTELPPEGVELVVKLAKERLLVTNKSASGLEQTVEVAHEALISNWGTLRAWVNEDREFLLWRDRLGPLVTEWERAQESNEALLRGPLLIEAQKWFDERSQDLSGQERKFISASREERERLAREEKQRHGRELEAARKLADAQKERAEQAEKARRLEEERAQDAEKRAKEQNESAIKLRRRAFVTAGAAGIALILLVVSVFLWRKAEEQAHEAEKQAQIANFRRLAAESSAALKGHPQRSLLLAVEAVKAGRSLHGVTVATAEQSLREALASVGGRPLAKADGEIKTLAISPDNHWLVTGSADNTARLWDLRATDPSANPVILRGHESTVGAVAISPDNHWLVTGSWDKTARLWDLRATDPSAGPVILRGHENFITAVAISFDNHWLVTGSADKTARLWDLRAADPAANPVILRGHEDFITAVAISPDNHWLVTGSADKTARLWDLRAADPAANPVILRGHENGVEAVAISPDNHWLVTGSADNTARLWNFRATDPAANPVILRGHESTVGAVAISPDNHWVVTGSIDKTARLWDLRATDPAANPVILRGHEDFITAVAISPDNHWVVTGGYDETARLWDLRAADPSANPVILRGHEGNVEAVAISPDNHWLVTGSADKTARLWNLSAEGPAANPVVLSGHEHYVEAVAISPDNHWVVTGSWDETARLWDLRAKDPGANPIVLRGHESTVGAVAISPDNHWLVTGSWDETARLWDLRATDPAANPVILRGYEDAVWAVAISPDNHWLVTGSADKTARLWDLRATDPAANSVILRGHEGGVGAVAISPDNHWVVTGSFDNTARLWDLRAADPSANPVVLRGHEGGVHAVAISPDNHWLVTGSEDKTARLWNFRATDPAANPVILRGHESTVGAVAISPDNHWVVTGSEDKTARLWDLRATDPAANPVILRGHEDFITAVAISPDNRWVVTGSEDNTARLWDLRAADPSANPVILRGHEFWVQAVAISPDNHWVVTGSWDCTARMWLLQVEDLVDLARTATGRNLSTDESTLYFPHEKYHQTFPDLPGPD
jgi:WD40 repeat protein